MTKLFPALLFACAVALTPIPAVHAKEAPPAATKSTLLVTLSKDQAGKSPTAAFTSADAAIFLHYQGADLKKGDKISAVWYIVDGGKGIKKNAKVSEGTQEANRNGAEGYLSVTKPATGWPAGRWRVDVSLNGTKVSSYPFMVSK